MKIVVTGGNGNIGAHIIRALLPLGHQILNFDRGPASIHPPEVRYIQGDRENTEAFIQTMQKEKPDVVFELTSHTPDHAKTSIEAFRGVQQFIVASTVCTYGKGFHHYPIREDAPFTPWTEYGIGKHKADQLYLAAYKNENFPVTIIKPGTTYSAMSGVLRMLTTEHSWIDRIKKGKPILICGDGDIMHQFMHAEDTAAGFVSVMDKKHCIGQIYNVVQDGFTTWAEFHQTAMDVLGQNVEMMGLPLAQLMELDPERFALCYEIFGQHTYASNEKLRRDAPEWQPRVPLAQGLGRVFQEMEQAGTIPDSDALTWEDDILSSIQRFRSSFSSIYR